MAELSLPLGQINQPKNAGVKREFNCIFSLPLNGSKLARINDRSVFPVSEVGTIVEKPSKKFNGFVFSSGSDLLNYPAFTQDLSSIPLTICWSVEYQVLSGYFAVAQIVHNSGAFAFLMYGSSSDTGYGHSYGPRGGQVCSFGGVAVAGAVESNVLVCKAGLGSTNSADYDLWINGVLQTKGSPSFSAGTNTYTTIGGLGGQPSCGSILSNFSILKGDLTTQARSISINPWQIFEEEGVSIYFTDVLGATGYTLPGSPGTYSLAGQSANLFINRVLAGTAGSYTFSAQNATLTYTPTANAYTLVCSVGTYVFTGNNATLLTNRIIAASPSSFSLTGLTEGLLLNRNLVAAASSYILTGQSDSLLLNRVLTSDVATFSQQGQPATLIYTPAGSYILTGALGSFNVTPQASNLLLNRILTGGAGNYSVNGITSSLLRGLVLPASVSSFLASGQNINLVYTSGYTLVGSTGSLAITGSTANLIVTRILAGSPAGYSITGQLASFSTGIAEEVGNSHIWTILIKRPSITDDILVKSNNHNILIKSNTSPILVK